MANTIVGPPDPGELRVRMSNGVTSSVVANVAIVASARARTPGEIALACAIGAADQSVFGIGCVGFDVRDLPWSRERIGDFEREKAFLIGAVRGAAAGEAAEALARPPNLEFISPCLVDFEHLLDTLSLDGVAGRETDVPLLPDSPGERCARHGVYLHARGCVVCNEE